MTRAEFLALCESVTPFRDARKVVTADGAYAGRVARTNTVGGRPWIASTPAPVWPIVEDFDTAEQAEAWLLERAA